MPIDPGYPEQRLRYMIEDSGLGFLLQQMKAHYNTNSLSIGASDFDPAKGVAVFAGDDLKTLYITTAHVALDAEQRKQQPLAGGLFRARVDVPGLPQGIVSHGI